MPNVKTDKFDVSGFDVARSVAARPHCMRRLWGTGKRKARERATAMVWASGHKHKPKKLLMGWIKDLEEKGEHSLLHERNVREEVSKRCKSQWRVGPKGLRECVNKSVVPELSNADIECQVCPMSKKNHPSVAASGRVYIRRRQFKGAYTDGHDAPAMILA